jgi:hypothetical protein
MNEGENGRTRVQPEHAAQHIPRSTGTRPGTATARLRQPTTTHLKNQQNMELEQRHIL